ncbi:MAG: hypothetical protein JNK05_37705 [Myxococcales bacterium]|nr:hypothetical protein [Myxococcales bacterium]
MTSIEEVRTRIQRARSLRELADIRANLHPLGPFLEDLWRRRIALCKTIDELCDLERRVRRIRSYPLRDKLERALTIREREIAFVTSAERAANDAPARERAALDRAIHRAHASRGAREAIVRYLAQREELYASTRPAYREALVSWLAARFPEEFESRARAEQAVAQAEEESVRRRVA